MLGKFSGHALMNTSAATRTDHLVVYTDIGKPTKAQFYDFDGLATTYEPFVHQPEHCKRC